VVWVRGDQLFCPGQGPVFPPSTPQAQAPPHGKFVLTPRPAGTGVFCHSKIVKHHTNTASQLPHFLRHVTCTFGFDDTNGKASQSSDIFRSISFAYPAAVLVKVPIDDVMAAVFDAPVASIYCQDALCIHLLGVSAGNAVRYFTGILAGLFFCELPLNYKGLLHMREVQVPVEFVSDPYFSNLDSAMVRRIFPLEIRLLAILEIQFEITEKGGLIFLHDKVVMGVALLDQIVGKITLGQQGIGGYILVLYINCFKQRNGGFDFICAFEFITAIYRKTTYFFWVWQAWL